MKNFWYLFAGYSVVWVVLLGYIYSLHTRQKKIQMELDLISKKMGL